MTLQYFAGGDPTDISDIHGVKDDKVLNSVWDVVDDIYQSHELDITFTETEVERCAVTESLKCKTELNIDC